MQTVGYKKENFSSANRSVVSKHSPLKTNSRARHGLRPVSCNLAGGSPVSRRRAYVINHEENLDFLPDKPIDDTFENHDAEALLEKLKDLDDPVEHGPPSPGPENYEDVLPFEDRLSLLPSSVFQKMYTLSTCTGETLELDEECVFDEDAETVHAKLIEMTDALDD
uniref:Uncharacterized protein n=1 Tax=Trichuris muris TaxID=70415 RepID=A0A5S6QNQ2_TRIMR